MSEMYAIRVEAEHPGEAVLEVRAVHPDAGPLPLPGHRPVWACALLAAVEYAPEEMTPELVWRVADTIAAVRLLEIRDHPRATSMAEPVGPDPTMRVRMTFGGGRRLFDFAHDLDDPAFRVARGAAAMKEGWGATVASRDPAAVALLPWVKGAERQIAALHRGPDGMGRIDGIPVPPDRCVIELARAGRRGEWRRALAALLSHRDTQDIVPIVLDHVIDGLSIASSLTLQDARLDEAIAIALGDPGLAGKAAMVIGLAGDKASQHARTVLAQVIAANANEQSLFRSRVGPNHVVGGHLAWAGMRVLGEAACARTLADLPSQKIRSFGMSVRGLVLCNLLDLAPERREEILDSWPGSRDFPELVVWTKRQETAAKMAQRAISQAARKEKTSKTSKSSKTVRPAKGAVRKAAKPRPRSR